MCFQNFMKNVCDEKCRIARTFSLPIIFPAPPPTKKKKGSFSEFRLQVQLRPWALIPLWAPPTFWFPGTSLVGSLDRNLRLWLSYSGTHFPRMCLHLGSQVMGRLEGEVRQWAFPHPLTPGTTAPPVNEDRSLPQSFGSCCLGFCCHHEIPCGLGSERTEKCK